MSKKTAVFGIVIVSILFLLALVLVLTPLRMFAVYPSVLLIAAGAWFFLKNKDQKIFLISAILGLLLALVALFYKPAASTEVVKDEKFEEVIENTTEDVEDDLDAALDEVEIEQE